MSVELYTLEKGQIKTITLTPAFGVVEQPITTIDYAYSTVPWLYRGITLIAQTVAAMPWRIDSEETGEPVEQDDRLAPISDMMGTILHLASLSRQLYGAAYFIAESNRFNLRNSPRYIPAPLVQPKFAAGTPEITSYSVAFTGRGAVLPPERVIRSWRPNPFSEVSPGIAPAYVALQAAGMLASLDQMATAYFRRGGVPITAVTVPPSASRDDREKLENWLQRVAGGLRNALRFLAISQGTEFKQIGANVRDTQAFELTSSQRDNVAVALGVPPTVLDGKSANFATANSEMMGFYLHTVIPEAEQIAEHFNHTFFSRFGLQLVIEKERLEIMQSAQLEQATILKDLTGGKAVLTVDEARDWLGLDPMTPAQDEASNPPPPPPQIIAGAAGSLPEPEPDDEEQMKAWREAALTQLRGGSAPTVGAPFDAELMSASSARMIRNVFEAHWPRAQKQAGADVMVQAVAELARYNALARGA